MDSREYAKERDKWWASLDVDAMIATVELEDQEGEELEIKVPFKFEVCPTCHGRGRHVDPAIDSHGITPEEFTDDPEFAQAYRAGRYDVPCFDCGGDRVVPEVDADRCDPYVREMIHNIQREKAQAAMDALAERRMGY